MGVNRIISLLVIIRVVENQAAPYASGGGSTCGGLNRKYIFVLNPAANEINLLTNLVESARSAVVRRPKIDGDPVQVIVSPEDFLELKRKSQASKVYKSHSLQCVDSTRNFAVVDTNAPRSSAAWTELNGGTKRNFSIEVTTLFAPKTTKELGEKMCKTLDDCKTEFRKKLMTPSPSNDVEPLLEASAPRGTILVGSSTSRMPRASKTSTKHPKKGTSKQKSKVKPASKLPNGKTRPRSKEQKKSAKNNGKSARKRTKANVVNKKTTLIPVVSTSTQVPWNRLMSMAAKSLTKSNPGEKIKSGSIAPGKLLSSASAGNAKPKMITKKNPSKQAKKPEAKNTRKSVVKTSASAAHKPKSSNTRNRGTQHRKPVSKPDGRRKSSSALNSTTRKTTAAKNRKGNRDSRELKIPAEPGTKCSVNNARKMKRSVGHYVKRDFTFHVPIACAVIKISCGSDCSEDNKESLPETVVNNIKDEISSQVPEESPFHSGQEKPWPNPPPEGELGPETVVNNINIKDEISSQVPEESPFQSGQEKPWSNPPHEGELGPETVVNNIKDEILSQVPEESPFHSGQEKPWPNPPPEGELVPGEPFQDMYEKSLALRPIKGHGDQPEELLNNDYGEMDESDKIPEFYEDERLIELPEELVDEVALSGELPKEYQELLNPSFDDYSATMPKIFHPDKMSIYPMIPNGTLRQPLRYGSTWSKPSPPRPLSVSPILASRPVGTLERPVISINDLRIPPESVTTWFKSPQAPFEVPGGFEEGIEDVDDDEDDEDEYGGWFEGDEGENGLEVSALPEPTQPQINPQDNFDEFWFKKNEVEADEGIMKDLDDEDYYEYDYDKDKYDNYNEDYENHENVEESGNFGVSDEDDYDLDEY